MNLQEKEAQKGQALNYERNANRDKFSETLSEDCDPLKVIRGISPSMNTLLYIF